MQELQMPGATGLPWGKKKKKKLGAQENKITNIYDPVSFDPDPLWGPSGNLVAHAGSPVHPPPA